MKRLLLISSDCHAGASWEDYRPYVEHEYRDRFDDWVAEKRASEAETRAWRKSHFPIDFQERYDRGVEAKIGRNSDLGWDVGVLDLDERTRFLEEDGVVAEVIFPDNSRRNAVPFRTRTGVGGVSPERVQAGSRAYNRWLADYCSAEPARRFGVAIVHLNDIEGALAEIAWAKDAGFHGMLMTATPEQEGLAPYDDPRYEPIWSRCEELEMPVHTHGAQGAGHKVFEQLVWSGALERHPDIKVAWTEQGADWIPPMLDEHDARYEQASQGLPRRPSEYWARNCWVGHSTRHVRADWELRGRIGLRNMMWGHDFPHPEGAWPYTWDAIRECFTGLSEEELRPLLGENAAVFYDIDVAKLEPIVERLGPDPTTLSETT